MGANAVTTVPVYVAGEVLTAADLNITNSGIPVFASTVERDAAFDGTGEKTLAEGQFAYLETGNVTQYYDGAAWQPVGVTPGLVLVATANPSAVSTVNIDNCFTSTYDNYLINISLSTVDADGIVNCRLRLSGTDATTNYLSERVGSVGATPFGATSTGGTDDMYLGNGHNGTNGYASTTTMFNPALARRTVALTTIGQQSGEVVQTVNNNHSTATAYDGISFIYTGTSMTGTIKIYGYANS
jgi:hypothetical protein